ncbi:MAG: electron transfer flavoprotein subunit beta/FixA family protein [Odoribacteraceae bacterium]|jgi:electron transfer flavoprotein beta subunit|nr:electron transfer flavoprotein subunit beta/FixA family protein [Odoribacteraceae bacterium]
MNTIVCIKQVPDTTEIKLDPVTGTMIREGVPSIMNPDDRSGLELALQLRERHGGTVTVITMGPRQAEAILREALALGVDRAILLSDRKFAGADTLATSNTLAGALRALPFDVIITGRQAIDGDTAQVGPQIAEHLDLPQVTYVERASLETPAALRVRRAVEEGHQTVEVDLPCLLTVLAGAVEPRYMSVRGIIEAYNKEIEQWDYSRVTVDERAIGLAGSPTRVFKSFSRGAKNACEPRELPVEEAVDLILAGLREKFII